MECAAQREEGKSGQRGERLRGSCKVRNDCLSLNSSRLVTTVPGNVLWITCIIVVSDKSHHIEQYRHNLYLDVDSGHTNACCCFSFPLPITAMLLSSGLGRGVRIASRATQSYATIAGKYKVLVVGGGTTRFHPCGSTHSLTNHPTARKRGVIGGSANL